MSKKEYFSFKEFERESDYPWHVVQWSGPVESTVMWNPIGEELFDSNKVICETYYTENSLIGIEEAERNARLIANSPKMLECLIEYVNNDNSLSNNHQNSLEVLNNILRPEDNDDPFRKKVEDLMQKNAFNRQELDEVIISSIAYYLRDQTGNKFTNSVCEAWGHGSSDEKKRLEDSFKNLFINIVKQYINKFKN